MRKVSTEQFIEKSKAAHPRKYSYEKTSYVDSYTKLIVTCPKHGDFFTTSQRHLYTIKKGCPGCGREKCRGKLGKFKRTNAECAEEAKKVHGDSYDYSESVFNPANKKTKIICAVHGKFFQSYTAHVIQKRECYQCGKITAGKSHALTNEEAEKMTKKHHKYSKRVGKDLFFNCPEHGEYKVHIANLYKTPDCPVCANKTSLAQEQIYAYVRQKTKARLNYIYSSQSKKEVDVFIPEKKIAIELNGLFWHSTGAPRYQLFPVEKRKQAAIVIETSKHPELEDLGIRLITITDFEWQTKKEAVKNILDHALGGLPRIYGRETEVRQINRGEAKGFMDRLHLQGCCLSKVYFGLFYKDELVAVMSFKKKIDTWELKRYCSSHAVVGGVGKLFKAFLLAYNPKKVISFCHERLFSGAIYEGLGFKKMLQYDYDYYFVSNGRQWHRQKFIRKRIPAEFQREGLFETTEACGAWTLFVPGGAKYEKIIISN